jgi:hypothetical protein
VYLEERAGSMPAVAALRMYKDQAKKLVCIYVLSDERVLRRAYAQVWRSKSINWIYQDDIRNFQSAKISGFSQDFLLAYWYSPGISHDEQLLWEGEI